MKSPRSTLSTIMVIVALAALALGGVQRVRREREASRLAARAAWVSRMRQKGYLGRSNVPIPAVLERRETGFPARKP